MGYFYKTFIFASAVATIIPFSSAILFKFEKRSTKIRLESPGILCLPGAIQFPNDEPFSNSAAALSNACPKDINDATMQNSIVTNDKGMFSVTLKNVQAVIRKDDDRKLIPDRKMMKNSGHFDGGKFVDKGEMDRITKSTRVKDSFHLQVILAPIEEMNKLVNSDICCAEKFENGEH